MESKRCEDYNSVRGIPLEVSQCSRQGKKSVGSTEEQVLVRFEFPDGSVAENVFLMGQTVQVLKAFLAAEFEIDMNALGLEYGGKIMLDPLSISDFAECEPSEGLDVYVLMDVDDWCRESKGK